MDPSIEIRRGRPEEREAFLDFITLVSAITAGKTIF